MKNISKISNMSELEEYIKLNNIELNRVYEIINLIDLDLYRGSDVELNPHSLLKPAQSGIDLESGIFEIIDNQIDANAQKCILKIFQKINTNKFSIIAIDDGNGIGFDELRLAISYAGFLEDKYINKNNVSGKFKEGLTNTCGCFSEKSNIYSNNGHGWNKISIDFALIKSIINEFENTISLINKNKRLIYREFIYKYILRVCISNPLSIKKDLIHIDGLSINDIPQEKGTIIHFVECFDHIINEEVLDEEIEILFESCGRRYYNKIDNGVEIVIQKKQEEPQKVRSIDISMKSLNCNYSSAFNSYIVNLKDYFKISDLTGDKNDLGTIDLLISAKQKSKKYAQKDSKHKNDKIVVPNILIIGQNLQGLSIERNGFVLVDNLNLGNVIHPTLNGVTFHININSILDKVIYVNGDKNGLSEKKLRRTFEKKIKAIATLQKLQDLKKGKLEEIIFTNCYGEEKVAKVTTVLQDNKNKIPTITPQDNKNKILTITPQDNKNKTSMRTEDSKEIIVLAATEKTELRIDNESGLICYKPTDDKYLIYDEINDLTGIRIKDLNIWWKKKRYYKTTLEQRLLESINPFAKYQIHMFNIFMNNIASELGDDCPALLPEVELYTSGTTRIRKENLSQRVDFYMRLPNRKK